VLLLFFLLLSLSRKRHYTPYTPPQPPQPPQPPPNPQAWRLDRQQFNQFYLAYSDYNRRLNVDVTLMPSDYPHDDHDALSVSFSDLYDFMNLDRMIFQRVLDAFEVVITYPGAPNAYSFQLVVDVDDEALYILIYKPVAMWTDLSAPADLASELSVLGFNRTRANSYYFEYFHN
jgi:hypothetical protein